MRWRRLPLPALSKVGKRPEFPAAGGQRAALERGKKGPLYFHAPPPLLLPSSSLFLFLKLILKKNLGFSTQRN
jgi:hypothetical protein